MSSTLYRNGTIITVNERREIILDGSIHVVGNRIAAIGKSSNFANSSSLPANTTIVDLEGRVVIPGLINAHAHLIQSLMRGLAEDMDLHRWACDAIWPLEASYEGDDGYIAAKLAMSEMLKSGTTCFLEPMLPSHAGFDRVSKALKETGIRGCLVSCDKVFNIKELTENLGNTY
jgi:cytosine/adenosine deaminase-related metal-dependent hydrolase